MQEKQTKQTEQTEVAKDLRGMSSKEFRKKYGPTMFWDSKKNGTYNYGKNQAKREKKLKKK